MPVTEARPVSERIADAILQRLLLLTAGYSDQFVASGVERPLRNDAGTPAHLRIVLTQDSPERIEDLDCPGNPPANCYATRYNIRCYVMPSENDTTPVEEYCNLMAGEVVRVVCDDDMIDDGTQWHTMGGMAVNAEWQAHENIDADGSYDGVNVPLHVTYRVSETNPFEVRA